MGRHKKDTSEKFYLGNTRLPGAGAEYEYTPEMVNDLKKSRKSLLYFAENFFYIVNLERGRELIKLHKYQKRILKALNNNRFCVLLSSRQSGKTTLLTIYALWIALFNEDQRILIVANKEQTAKNIFKRVRLAYELLPNYLKAGVIEWGQTSMSLTNGSSIGISTTSSDAGRGESVNCLILDELAFIEPGMLDSFWRSVYPIISSSKKSKILVASTPNGVGNLFHSLYVGAKTGDNGWHAERVDWWEVPGRDEEWKDNTIKTLQSKEAFMQEYENVFLSSGENIFYEGAYEILESGIIEPTYVFDEGSYLVWNEPKDNRLYVAGVDVGEGLNLNASCIQILDITDLSNIEQVACYNNRKISPYYFTQKLKEILDQWGKPPVCIERNNCGAQVVDNLKNVYGYESIITWGAKSGEYSPSNRFGILSHTNTKSRGITNMRYWVNEIRSVKIRDAKTLIELKDFIRFPNGTWGSRTASLFDDRVMALVWALIILENEICQRQYEIIKYDDNQRPLVIKDLDYGVRTVINPVGLYTNERDVEGNLPLPTTFTEISLFDSTTGDPELDQLLEGGWTFLDK
jgi:hypothetical protein